MRAVVYREFGSHEVLGLEEVEPPPLGRDAVLVRIHAAAVNPVDWKIRAGRLAGVLETWFPAIPGWDFAGVVERVGPAVTELAAGDRVLGYARMDVVRWGTAAEYIAAPIRTVAKAPDSWSLQEASTLPLAGLTAYQSLHGALGVGTDDVLYVNAAAGGVGTFAMQIAAAAGATVIASTSPRNFSYVEGFGARPVDRHAPLAEGLARHGLRITAAFDAVGGEALDELTALTPRVCSIADARVGDAGGAYVFARPDRADLGSLVALADAGQLRTELSEVFPLEETAAAHALSERRSTRGKITIAVA
ncbi:NADP-dependent oxidoreductase [Leucobacter sp. CSA1]|uniref:NADP-dependent oxidoreductase n=1 Tax=Leucobacter chromiisoli TaxID=2796471 RepID=A0A934UWE9_9MICO|nr:NADP-dependent oxidoreductase [Leucobacter chromiisoli]MBK0420198.1 NADP-dependent oxidoreductase [Leucobacter chromiisoli]